MMRLEKTLAAWQTADFEEAFKREVGQLGVEQLPLQQALSQGSYASDRQLKVLVISAAASQDIIQVKAGIFFTGIVPGCACSDDPAPDNEYTEYCEVLFTIDQQSAVATLRLLAE
ncbi:MAG: hypothetical protein WBP44_10215 [Gammaproteobacteria bacterium]|jgi:hypothetical protein